MIFAAVLVLLAALLPATSASGQAAQRPELTVHRLIKPKSIRDFIRRGECAVVSCDVNCNVVMRLVASRRVARILGHPNSRVIAKGVTPIFEGLRGVASARPRGIVRRWLKDGALSGGFSFKIRIRAFAAG